MSLGLVSFARIESNGYKASCRRPENIKKDKSFVENMKTFETLSLIAYDTANV